MILRGNSAAVMAIAKRGMDGADYPNLLRLQAAIAVMAGLRSPSDVRIGEVLRIVATLHDELTEGRLLYKPAQSLVDSLVRSYVMGPPKEDAPRLLLNCLLSNMCVMRIRTEGGEQLVDWESELPEDFRAHVERLCREATAPEAAAA